VRGKGKKNGIKSELERQKQGELSYEAKTGEGEWAKWRGGGGGGWETDRRSRMRRGI